MAQVQFERWRSELVYSEALDVYQAVLGEGGLGDCFPEFLDGVERAAVPHKHTMLHVFIESVNAFLLDYSTGKFPEYGVGYYRQLLREAGMPMPRWLTKQRVSAHVRELDPLLVAASRALTPSIFCLLFSDRTFLSTFQHRVADWLRTVNASDHPALLVRDGVLRRPKRLPQWLKAAIYHRDRGRCQYCNKDMTGRLRPIRDLHLDHIVPLAASGSNDPTNFQLTCATCNTSKGKHTRRSAHYFEPYW